MDDTTVDAGCPAHGDGTPICTCGELEALDRLRAERDTLAAAVQALADQWEKYAVSLVDRPYAYNMIDTVQTYRHCAEKLRVVLAEHADKDG